MQKNLSLPFLCLLGMLIGCQPATTLPAKAENELDAARLFIRLALDGKFDEAKNFMLQDSVNNSYLDITAQLYQKIATAEKENYKAATIVIHRSTPVNDSVSVVIYSNSFKNDHDTLRIVKNKEAWLVDLKYLYEHEQP
jgi:hypothetical protein